MGWELDVERGIGQGEERRTGVVDLATARIDRFQQLVDFIITHFLAEVGQN